MALLYKPSPISLHTSTRSALLLSQLRAVPPFSPLRQPTQSQLARLLLTRPLSSSRRLNQHQPVRFDTSLFVEKLQKQGGLSRGQAEGLMVILKETVDESVKGMMEGLVSRTTHEKHQFSQKVDFAKLKSELHLYSNTDYQALKSENERLLADIESLKRRLNQEIMKTQGGVRLDLNLEKGRIRDELTQRDLKLREVDARIENEISGLRTAMEQIKLNIVQYLVGTLTGSLALLLAFLRMTR
ncbi:DUF1640-domain-containing protein [Atractiella rhizophila]|nr:DUF1640-domain-containing protein [Atractiella rhizophila]